MDLFHIAARIASVPIEAYRHKSGKFDLSKFKGLDPSEMFEYAKSTLEEIGRGSSRAAFVLSSGKVLKIAVHQVGGDDEGLPHADMTQILHG
jgi:hypothetical protein